MSSPPSKTFALGFAGRDYDRTRALIDHRVVPNGIDLSYQVLEDPELIFRNMLERGEYESCEFSLSTFISLNARGDSRFVALPVFPSRLFRHSFIFCNVDSKITKPTDLVGKKVGLMEWQQTSAVWIKGILQDEYAVPIEKIRWIAFKGERDSHFTKLKKFKVELTPDLNPDTADQRSADAIESGEIDALIVARTPITFRTGNKVKRLFEDPIGEEIKFYQKTHLFPIMHTIVVKSEIYRGNEWIGPSLVDAFNRAKEIGYKYLEATGDRVGAVWVKNILETQNKVMGRDIYPYGLEPNRRVIETLIKYQFEQEILDREVDARELFASNTL